MQSLNLKCFFFSIVFSFFQSLLVFHKLILGIWKHQQEFVFSFFSQRKLVKKTKERKEEEENGADVCVKYFMSFSISCLPMLLWGGGHKGCSLDVSSRLFKGGTAVFTTISQAVTVTLPWVIFSSTFFVCAFKVGMQKHLNQNATANFLLIFFIFYFFFLALLTCRSETHTRFYVISGVHPPDSPSLIRAWLLVLFFKFKMAFFLFSIKVLTVALHIKQWNEESHLQKAPSAGASQF